jgi:uncharacterized protein YegL
MTNITQNLPTLPQTGTAPAAGDATMPLAGGQGSIPFDGANLPVATVKKQELPDGISSNCKQLVFLVRDCSSSMAGPKIEELNKASISFLKVLADKANKDGFLVSVVDFQSSAKRATPVAKATVLTLPNAIAGGGTNFDSALKETILAINEFKVRPNQEGWHYLRPQVLFLSDGQSPVADKNILELQEIATVTAVAYGSDADTTTLTRISSANEVHIIGTRGGDLRKFLARVGQTMSQELAIAAQPLT